MVDDQSPQQHRTSLADSPTSSQKTVQIGLILGRLALHCPPRGGIEESQFKLVIEDMVRDLNHLGVYEIERACAAWRSGKEPDQRFFPTSGQLIGSLPEPKRDIPRYQPPALEPDRKYPRELRPCREILRANGRDPNDMRPDLADQLDRLQAHNPPQFDAAQRPVRGGKPREMPVEQSTPSLPRERQ